MLKTISIYIDEKTLKKIDGLVEEKRNGILNSHLSKRKRRMLVRKYNRSFIISELIKNVLAYAKFVGIRRNNSNCDKKIISICLESDLYDQIESLCKIYNCSRNVVILDLIQKGLLWKKSVNW